MIGFHSFMSTSNTSCSSNNGSVGSSIDKAGAKAPVALAVDTAAQEGIAEQLEAADATKAVDTMAEATEVVRPTRTAHPLRNRAVLVPLQPISVRKAVISPPGDRTALK